MLEVYEVEDDENPDNKVLLEEAVANNKVLWIDKKCVVKSHKDTHV